MQLLAYYRVSARGNGKPRPPWFDPQAAWLSFAGGLRDLDARVVVVADGGVPRTLQPLLPEDVTVVRGGTAARSFRQLLGVAVDGSRWLADDALVWFAEDDHVYRPEALGALVQAAGALPQADLFSLYTPDNAAWHVRARSQPGREGPQEAYDVDGTAWRRTWASTSTFGLRAGVLREDRHVLAACSGAGGPWDHTCVSVLQGVAPYPVRHLGADLFLRPSLASAGRVWSRPLLRACLDLAAAGRSRTWVAPVVDLATHAELGHVAPGTDWARLTRRVQGSTPGPA